MENCLLTQSVDDQVVRPNYHFSDRLPGLYEHEQRTVGGPSLCRIEGLDLIVVVRVGEDIGIDHQLEIQPPQLR